MSTLFRNTFYTSLAQGWQMLMALVLFKFATIYLHQWGWGAYTLATTLMMFVLLLDDFGLNTLTTREIARDKGSAQHIFSTMMGLKLGLMSISLLFILIYTLCTPNDPETVKAIWIFALFGLMNSFTMLGYAVFRAFERMELETGITVLEKTLTTGLGILVLVLGKGLIPFSCMFFLVSIVSLALSFIFLNKWFVKIRVLFDWTAFKKTLSASAAFGVALFVTISYDRMGILLLPIMQDLKATGLYSAAHKLLNFTSLVPTIFATAFFPKFSIYVNDRSKLSQMFTTGVKYLMILAIPLIPAVFILSRKIVVFFSNEEYLDASTAMAIMSITSGLNFINIFLASLYGATNHQRRILVIELAGLLMNIVSNCILIPKYSFMGSVWATLITEIIVIGFALTWSVRNIATFREWSFIPKIIFASAVMSGCLLFTKQMNLIVNVLIGGSVYFLCMFLSKTVDIKQIRKNFAELKSSPVR